MQFNVLYLAHKTCSETFHIGDKIFGETFAVKHFVDKTCGEKFMLKTRLLVNHFVLQTRFCIWHKTLADYIRDKIFRETCCFCDKTWSETICILPFFIWDNSEKTFSETFWVILHSRLVKHFVFETILLAKHVVFETILYVKHFVFETTLTAKHSQFERIHQKSFLRNVIIPNKTLSEAFYTISKRDF